MPTRDGSIKSQERCYYIQPNDCKHYIPQHTEQHIAKLNGTQYNYTQHNDTQHNGTQYTYTQHNDSKHNVTQHNAHSA